MIRKLIDFKDAVLDKIFWFFFGLAILVVGAIALAADLFFKKKISEHLNAGNPIEYYRAWQIQNPKMAWCAQWVLLLLAL
jgi:hypothetical protein